MHIDVTPWWDFPRTPAASRMLVDAGVAHGLDVQDCLGGTQLTYAAMSHADRIITANQELRIARNVVRALDYRPGIGAAAGVRYELGAAGIIGFAMITSSSFREAIQVGIRFAKLSSMFTKPSYEEDNDYARVVLDDSDVPADVRDMLVERDIVALAKVLPVAAGGGLSSLQPIRLELHLEEIRLSSVRRFLPDATITPAEQTSFVVPVSMVHLPLPTAEPSTAQLCVSQCDAMLEDQQKRPGTGSMVRAMLLRNSSNMPDMSEVAARLHVEPRTLNRYLNRENTSFRAIRDQVRESLALELLSNAGLTVEEVARRLGYAETAAFCRAFKRWTGNTPTQRQHRQTADRNTDRPSTQQIRRT